MTQAELAQSVKKTRGAVAQWESGEVRPRHSTLKAIAEATSVDLLWLESGIDQKRVGLTVVGLVAAGTWREEELKLQPYVLPVAPHPDYPAHAQRLYRVEGSSLNRIVQDGAYLHAVDIMAANLAPAHGHLVVVQRRRHGTVEYTAKRYMVENGKRLLRPESTDSMWQEDVDINGDDDTEIAITDIVLAQWSPIGKI